MTDAPSYAILKTIGELSRDGVFVYCSSSKVLEYVNPTMLKVFDISHDTFRHQTEFFVSHVSPDDLGHVTQQFQVLKKQSCVENVEFRIRSHDGYTRTIMCSAYVVGELIVGFVRDITSNREYENYVTSYSAKKDALLDIVAHNLSGPLTITQEILSTLDTSSGNPPKNIDKAITIVRESTNHCIEIVNDFLEEEHLVSEHITVKKTRFDVVQKINNILERTRRTQSDKHFLFDVKPSRLIVYNDEVKFMQVVHNLISNAIKFTGESGKIIIKLEAASSHFSVAVQDNGIGIPESIRPVLFQKYTPAGRTGLGGERSVGMGLYIVRQLVQLMGGSVAFTSTEGKGSEFVVTIPLP
jgi:two-component system, OmpR family, sensor histidine kinase VicK